MKPLKIDEKREKNNRRLLHSFCLPCLHLPWIRISCMLHRESLVIRFFNEFLPFLRGKDDPPKVRERNKVNWACFSTDILFCWCVCACVFISSSGTWYVDNPLFLACPTNSEMSSTSLSPSEVLRTVAKQENLMCQMLTEARKHFHLFPLVFSPVDTYWNIANFSLWFFSRVDQHMIKTEATKQQQRLG